MTRDRPWLLLGLALLTLAPGVPAQQRDPTAKPVDRRVGTAIVAGRVMSSDTGDTPVRRAIVTLISTERVESVSTVTDNDGRPVPEALIKVHRIALVHFGGYTDTAASGAWLDGNGVTHHDQSVIVTVDGQDGLLTGRAVADMAQAVLTEARQECVYVTRQDSDGFYGALHA